jgi:hypothetical protein
MFSVSRRTKRRRVTEELKTLLQTIQSQSLDVKPPDEAPAIQFPHEDDATEQNINIVNNFENGIVNNLTVDLLPRVGLLEFKDRLAAWSLRNNVTLVATSELLKIVRDEFNVALPNDARSLLKTSRKLKSVAIGDGSFYYFGAAENIIMRIRSGLRRVDSLLLRKFSSEHEHFVSVSVGIDGLPISRSNNKQFWPILGKVDQSNNQSPFVIALYFGTTKPNSIEQFLSDFTIEFKHLEEHGVMVDNINYIVKISNFICDAPARSFVKQCKSHNSYHGCERCIEEGRFIGRVVFDSLNSNERTDCSFRAQTDIDHHIGLSPLVQLKLDLVEEFPLDYMHLVCLGIVRKLLYSWMKGPLRTRLLPRNINRISLQLLEMRPFIPNEFKRKPRSLKELDHFKATEFRLFLLYTGTVVMKSFLSTNVYRNFLKLHSSIYILLSDYADHPKWNPFVKKLLISFVQEVKLIYGPEFLSYNMHSLVHLSDDARKNGKLDRISALPFENYMQILKKHLRSKSSQLSQVMNRITECQQQQDN